MQDDLCQHLELELEDEGEGYRCLVCGTRGLQLPPVRQMAGKRIRVMVSSNWFDKATIIPKVRDIFFAGEGRGHLFFAVAADICDAALYVDGFGDILLGYNESSDTYSVWVVKGRVVNKQACVIDSE